ncbi:fatty acid desaturase family protein [Nocardia cyriacigeorgica]|uniref:fatty acid desaturase family protein n=1 Tax=Nocardia cyriacigeorgica TaxID=135487 RepID=UPI001895668E|nr:acyl-CoA desaturase [Nocardia cyriacigeorgica]MBF6090775.1 acyl-CoA desaturase [Nocardia cyriacigeorgica]
MTTPTLSPAPTRRGGAGGDYAALLRRVSEAGLMDRRPVYYAVRLGLVGFAFAAGWSAFVLVGNSWWTLLVAALMAVTFAQVALVMHDVAHRQVFRLRRPTEIIGRVVGNAGIGLGYGWWQDKHTRHHANPNHEELDPDVAPDILVWSQQQARASRGLPRLIGRAQAYLFFPLLMLEGLNLHVAGVRALRKRTVKHRVLEGALLFGHFAIYLTALFVILPADKASAFFVVHQALFGVYMGCIFAPNHKGMPTLTGEDRPDFLRRQVLTSRNVKGGKLIDIALGGLNYQIEHHLFPSMPTPNLRHAQVIVRDYCAEIGVPYHETGLIASYREALKHMHHVGAPLRGGRESDL